MVGKTNVGGGGGAVSTAWAYIAVTYPAGSTCTATNGTTTLNAQGTSGLYVFQIPKPTTTPETWTVSCTDGTKTKSGTAEISAQYSAAVVELKYSRLPDGYQEVEYIEATYSSASQFPYIDTDVVFAEKSEIDLTYMALSSNVYICGSHHTSTDSGRTIVECPVLGNGIGSYRLGDNIYSASASINVKHNVILSRNRCVEDDVALTAVETGTFRSGATPLYLFAENMYGNAYQYSSASARIYSYTLTDTSNNTITQQLIPCYRISDNTAGMIDLVSKTFLANAGTGTFLVGPDV